MSTDPALYDHLRPTGRSVGDATVGNVDPGIYRVVGVQEDAVALLRVADEDGQRYNTGEVTTVDRTDLAEFERAENPDGNRPIGATVASQLTDLAWTFRAFARSLARRPLLSGVAVGIYLAGQFGERLVTAPDWLFTGAVFVGIFALVFVGSGRA